MYLRFLLWYLVTLLLIGIVEAMMLRQFEVDVETSISWLLPLMIAYFFQGRAIVKADGRRPEITEALRISFRLALVITALIVAAGIFLLVSFSPDWAILLFWVKGRVLVEDFFIVYPITGFFLWLGTRAVSVSKPASGKLDAGV